MVTGKLWVKMRWITQVLIIVANLKPNTNPTKPNLNTTNPILLSLIFLDFQPHTCTTHFTTDTIILVVNPQFIHRGAKNASDKLAIPIYL